MERGLFLTVRASAAGSVVVVPVVRALSTRAHPDRPIRPAPADSTVAGAPRALRESQLNASVGAREVAAKSLSHGGRSAEAAAITAGRTGGSSRCSRGLSVVASVAATTTTTEKPPATANKLVRTPIPWTWTYESSDVPETSFAINTIQYGAPSPSPSPSTPLILLLPAISDVSTVEEWELVVPALLNNAAAISSSLRRVATAEPAAAAAEAGAELLQVVAADWPGFGQSGSPPVLYTAAMMERFVVDLVGQLAPGNVTGGSGSKRPLVLVGGGHAATLALKAVAGADVAASAVVAAAPTWAGPLPIVFGNGDDMKFRYGVFRNLLRSPGLGWALYRYGLTSEKNMRMQYLTHVYSSADNVTPDLVQRRTEGTRREGARFGPASFVSGLLDSCKSRDEFLATVATAGEKGARVLVLSASGSPKRSKREMEALDGATGVEKYALVPGALLPQEEYPTEVGAELVSFLSSL